MKRILFEDFMKKYNINPNTVKESHLQRVYNYPIYQHILFIKYKI